MENVDMKLGCRTGFFWYMNIRRIVLLLFKTLVCVVCQIKKDRLQEIRQVTIVKIV